MSEISKLGTSLDIIRKFEGSADLDMFAPVESIQAQEPVQGYANIFGGMPVHGSILAHLTTDESKLITDMSERMNALERLGDRQDLASYQDLQEKYRNAWYVLCEKYKIPYAWPIAHDPYTGYIYLDNK